MAFTPRLLAFLAGATLLASCASSPPPPVSAVDQGTGARLGDVDVEVAGPVSITFKEITLEPGASTGVHCHDGNLIAIVTEGVLTHYAPLYPTGVHEYRAGDAIIEGPHYLHEGRNEGTEPVVLEVTYVIPEGFPLAETDPSKCDPAGTV